MRMRYPHKVISPLILAGVAASLLGMNGAIAQATSGPALCAARDLEVITLIENHGAANDVASARLANAGVDADEGANRLFGWPGNGGDCSLR